MPELPEVETIRIGLGGLLPGRIIASSTHDNAKSFPNSEIDANHYLMGAKILKLHRRGKVLIINLSSNYSLVIHLKMTGQLVYRGDQNFGAGHPNDSLINNLPDKSTRVTLGFKDGSKLFFNDQRKFGWVKLLPTSEVPNIDFLKRIGPEPLDADFSAEQLYRRLLKRPGSAIKAVLLDQSIIAGVGNIYADESLWKAHIHPSTLVKNLTKASVPKLLKALQDILNESIKYGGSTDRNYVNAEGKKGSYLKFAKVFRRQGQPCPRCGHTIIKIKVAGRGTHICPHCQKVRLP